MAILALGGLLAGAYGATIKVHFTYRPLPQSQVVQPATPPPVPRVMVIILDALSPVNAFVPEYMPVLNRLAAKGAWGTIMSGPVTYSGSAALTMGTGSSPSLIDTARNWTAPAFKGHSMFSLAREAGLKTAVSGFDAWERLYGQHLDFSTPIPDKGINDVDQTDPTIKKDGLKLAANRDYRLILLHLGGSDHAGHKYGTNHPEYRRKIKSMDAYLDKVSALLGPNDVLIVTADHGSDDLGSHGDSSLRSRLCPIVFYGGPIKQMANLDMEMSSFVPTITSLLGIAAPPAAEGAAFLDMVDIDGADKAALLLNQLDNRLQFMGQVEITSGKNLKLPHSEAATLHKLAAQGQYEDIITRATGLIDNLGAKYRGLRPISKAYGVIWALLTMCGAFLIPLIITRPDLTRNTSRTRNLTILALIIIAAEGVLAVPQSPLQWPATILCCLAILLLALLTSQGFSVSRRQNTASAPKLTSDLTTGQSQHQQLNIRKSTIAKLLLPLLAIEAMVITIWNFYTTLPAAVMAALGAVTALAILVAIHAAVRNWPAIRQWVCENPLWAALYIFIPLTIIPSPSQMRGYLYMGAFLLFLATWQLTKKWRAAIPILLLAIAGAALFTQTNWPRYLLGLIPEETKFLTNRLIAAGWLIAFWAKALITNRHSSTMNSGSHKSTATATSTSTATSVLWLLAASLPMLLLAFPAAQRPTWTYNVSLLLTVAFFGVVAIFPNRITIQTLRSSMILMLTGFFLLMFSNEYGTLRVLSALLLLPLLTAGKMDKLPAHFKPILMALAIIGLRMLVFLTIEGDYSFNKIDVGASDILGETSISAAATAVIMKFLIVIPLIIAIMWRPERSSYLRLAGWIAGAGLTLRIAQMQLMLLFTEYSAKVYWIPYRKSAELVYYGLMIISLVIGITVIARLLDRVYRQDLKIVAPMMSSGSGINGAEGWAEHHGTEPEVTSGDWRPSLPAV